MEDQEAPASPTGEFRAIDTGTFEIFDGNSAVQNRKRRRSSLRRVSFAEQPSIHVFARDDDYETPPEGTMSHLSAQSTPTSVSGQSPHRRSERLAAAARGGGRYDENEVDKENASVAFGSSARPSRRGRRPLALRDTQKEKEEEFLKPSNWLDHHEHSAFGSCDDNSGPVDVRHISFENQSVEVDDDDNMTMDSQTFHTRLSLMKQPLPRLSETTWTRTPGQFSDMDSIHEQLTDMAVALHDRQGSRGHREQESPTWHRGDGRNSDMSETCFDELPILTALAKKRAAAKESSVYDSAENAEEGRGNWAEDDARSQGRIRSMELRRTGSLLDVDDAVSMDTSSPQSTAGRGKLLVNDREQDVRDSEGLDGSQMQGIESFKQQDQSEFRPITRKGTSMFNYDGTGGMETSSQSRAAGNDSTMEIDSGTGEQLFIRDVQRSTVFKESEPTSLERTARQSVHQAVEQSGSGNIALNPSVKSGASEDSPMPLKQYGRKLKRASTTAAEKDVSVAIKPRMDFKNQLSKAQGHVQSIAEASLVRQGIGHSDRQETSSERRTVNTASRKSMGLEARDGFVSQGVERETLLSAPDDNTESMDITRAWNGRAPQHASVPTRSSDSAKSFLWVDKEHSMDMSDVDMTEKYQEGITEAMPRLDFVLDGYNCDSPSAEPLNRILQRKSGIDGEDSPVYGVTAEFDTKKALSSRKCDEVARSGGAEEKEIVRNQGLEEDTDELQFNIGKKRAVFQNPEDTFSFRGHHKSIREASVSPSMEQNVMQKPILSKVRERVNTIEGNLRNQIAPQNSGRNFQDEDTTGEYTVQHDWRAEVSSDMSTTPLSSRLPSCFHRPGTKSQAVPALTETRLTDSPSFQDGITAAIPNVQDLLAADARTPESELGWNPRKIEFSAQQSTRQTLVDEEGLCQSGTDKMENQNMHSMPDKICTPTAQDEKDHIFECMTEEGARTLNQLSHSKEVRNSAASKLVLRMMSLQDDARAQAGTSSDGESQQILRRTLQFQPESDCQLQAQSLIGDAEQQISAEDPDGAMEVESMKNMDEETNSTESGMNSPRQEARRQKLLQEVQVAEERLAGLERRSEELQQRAQDCHKAIAKRCRNASCSDSNELAAFCSQLHVSELKKRCQLLHSMQGWKLTTTKIGDCEVLHEFKYWSLLTHRIFERKENKIVPTVSRSSVDLNEESINKEYRHMDASLAWRWFLSGNEEVIQPQSLYHHVQGVNFKVVMLLDLMKEVHNCRKHLVIPCFRFQTGTDLHLGIQFSDSELLFDFVLLLDMRQLSYMRYSRRDYMPHELDSAPEMNLKLDCTLEMESAGRFFGKKITEAEIMSVVASVVPGRQFLLRVCESVNALFMRIKESVS